MRTVTNLAIVAGLLGCQSTNPPLPAVLAPTAATPLYAECESETCDARWERAERWIAKHAKTRVQLVTSAVIRTQHPTQSDDYLFWVRREPADSGRARITLELLCGDQRGCSPAAGEVRGAFVHYVLTGEDLLAGRRGLRAIR